MNRSRVLFLSHERKLGGATISLLELCKALKEEGYDVHVAVLFHGCPIDKALKEAGIPTVAAFYGWWQMPENWNILLKTAFRFLHWLQFIPKAKLKRYIKKHNIDIIHSNSSTLDIGLQIKKEMPELKHVYHFREFGREHYHFEFLKGRENSIKEIEKYADEIVFISKALIKANAELGVKEKKHVIYNAVRITEYSKKDSDKAIVKFLQTGTINPGKNQLLLLEASKILLDRGIEDFEIEFAGDAASTREAKAYKQSLVEYIDNNNINNAKLLGRISDMVSLRKNVDVEVVPSRWEAFGRVTAEAMMAGIPVIVSDSGANPELVNDGENGFVFKCDDANSLADVMEKAILQKENLIHMREKCREHALTSFTLDRLVNQIEYLYQR